MKRVVPVATFALLCAGLWVLPGLVPWPDGPIAAALLSTQAFLRRHLLTSILPAFLIAGAISALVNRAAIVRYLGPDAPRPVAYGVAAIGGGATALCSCMVLPLFAGIYMQGAGLGPAIALLYVGPAISVMAILLTATVLGLEIGLARAVAAIVLGLLVGVLMQRIFAERVERPSSAPAPAEGEASGPRGWKVAVLLALIVGLTAAAHWAWTGDIRATLVCCPGGEHYYQVEGRIVYRDAERMRIKDSAGFVHDVPRWQIESVNQRPSPGTAPGAMRRWGVVAAGSVLLLSLVIVWLKSEDVKNWMGESWALGRRIIPIFLLGVFVTGFLFGHPGQDGLVPREWVTAVVGGRGPLANAAASVAGAGMYFATLTEVPILRGLLDAGMGHGPALALLLAGPAVSLPAMLAIRQVIGTAKTAVYVLLVVCTATLAGLIFGLVPLG